MIQAIKENAPLRGGPQRKLLVNVPIDSLDLLLLDLIPGDFHLVFSAARASAVRYNFLSGPSLRVAQ